MDELIPYREPQDPLVKHVVLENLKKIIEPQPIIPTSKAKVVPQAKKSSKKAKLPPLPTKIQVPSKPRREPVAPEFTQSKELDGATRMQRMEDMLVKMIEVLDKDGGQMREMAAVLLSELEDFPRPTLDYMAGSYYMGGNPACDGRPPQWLLTAVSIERTKLAFDEQRTQTIGTLACPADVLTALYPPYYLMNCRSVYVDICDWCMYQVMPKYAPDLMGGLLLSQPPSYDSIRYEYEELATLVRRKIVESSQLSRPGDRKKKRKKSR